jgi:hypothetical protein
MQFAFFLSAFLLEYCTFIIGVLPPGVLFPKFFHGKVSWTRGTRRFFLYYIYF